MLASFYQGNLRVQSLQFQNSLRSGDPMDPFYERNEGEMKNERKVD